MRVPTPEQKILAVSESLRAVADNLRPENATQLAAQDIGMYALAENRWNEQIETSYSYDARTGKVHLPEFGGHIARDMGLRVRHLLSRTHDVSAAGAVAAATHFSAAFAHSLRQQNPGHRLEYYAREATGLYSDTAGLVLWDDQKEAGAITDGLWRYARLWQAGGAYPSHEHNDYTADDFIRAIDMKYTELTTDRVVPHNSQVAEKLRSRDLAAALAARLDYLAL